MDELLPFYERELAFLRQNARAYAERYPKIAGRLQLSGDVSPDPHVERLIESFALLSARVSKKIEDDYPEFTEALLEVLYPHYLRAFPACSIARLESAGLASQLSTVATVPRGTELESRPVRGVPCRFRSAYDVRIAPLALTKALFRPVALAPQNQPLPPGASSQITLSLRRLSGHGSAAGLGLQRLRLFIDAEASFCAALRQALGAHILAAYAEADNDSAWHQLEGGMVHSVGFAADEALIDYPAHSHPAFRLLTEFFAFPEKFNFIDIDFANLTQALPPHCTTLSLHLILGGIRSDSSTAQTLEALSPDHLLTGCTPVVNLFRQCGEPIRVNHRRTSYPVIADARRAHAYEINAIESVKRVRHSEQDEKIVHFHPFYSLRHGQAPDPHGRYWLARRDPAIARSSPGYEYEITLVDMDMSPTAPRTDTLSLELTCTNRNLPESLAYGPEGGDLTIEGNAQVRQTTLLRKPTPSRRFEHGHGSHWRLISQLALDHLSLVQGGLPALKQMLRLYDLVGSSISSRHVDGIVGLAHRPTTAWLQQEKYAAVVRGLEITLTLEEENFVGAGVLLFAQVLDRFFGFYTQANSFTELVFVAAHSQEELLRCPARSGETTLA